MQYASTVLVHYMQVQLLVQYSRLFLEDLRRQAGATLRIVELGRPAGFHARAVRGGGTSHWHGDDHDDGENGDDRRTARIVTTSGP